MTWVVLLAVIVGGYVAWEAFAEKFPLEQRMLGFQDALSPVMERITHLHDILLVMCFAISGLVLALIAYVCVRYNRKVNPLPSKTSHNTVIEIVWTAIPVLILVALLVPSLRLLYFMDKTVDADMTLKVIGYQWYWGYEYPDNGAIAFESYILKDEDLKPGQKRLLETDNRVILPVDTNVRVLATAADVIHAWAMPAIGVKIDAVPGRTNETWLRINKPGVYYGQCSELCGTNHGFMPIVIEAVSKEDFQRWVAGKTAAAGNNAGDKKMAAIGN